MSESLNISNDNIDYAGDYLKKIGRTQTVLITLLIVKLIVIVILVLIMVLKEPHYIAVEDGVPIGRVQLYSHALRPNEVILADIKDWVARCSSISSMNIVQDMAVCLSHMEPEMSEERLTLYEEKGVIQTIIEAGCERTKTEFDDSKNTIHRDESGEWAQANIYGKKLCFHESGEVAEQPFSVITEVNLEIKTKGRPFGFKVYRYDDL